MRFMWDRKKQTRLWLCYIAILFLSACTATQPAATIEERIAAVEEQGLLLIIDHQTENDTPVAQRETETVTATIGTFTARMDSMQLWPWSLRSQTLFFQRDHGMATLLIPRRPQFMYEGQKLAHLPYDNERMEIDRADALRQLEQHNRSAESEAQRLRTRIEEARHNLDMATERDWVELALLLTQAELAYDRFRVSTEITRGGLQQRLTDLEDTLAGEYLLAPFDGYIQFFSTHQDRFPLTARNQPILTVGCFDTFILMAQVNHEQLLLINYGSSVTVRTTVPGTTVPVEIDAIVVSDPWATGQRGHNFSLMVRPVDLNGFWEAVYDMHNDKLYTLQRLTFRILLDRYFIDHGIVLPVHAVNFHDGLWYVWAYEDGYVMRRFVEVGNQHGGYRQIVTGIEAGTKVVIR